MMAALAMALNPISAKAAGAAAAFAADSCGSMKTMYKQASCCGHPDQSSQSLVVPLPDKKLANTNICVGKKPSEAYWDNRHCSGTGLEGVLE